MKLLSYSVRTRAFSPSLLAAGVLSAFNASAWSQSAEPLSLAPVVITATRMPQLLPDTIANTTLITRAEIDRSGALDLPSLLANQAGIELGRNGGVGHLSNVFMRGANSSQTLVLIDGTPVNDNNFGTANLELLPLDAIERIEIVRGNVSAQYGSQAIGGVIALYTRAPKAGLTGGVSAELGTQGHKKLSATVAGGTQDTQARLTLNQLKTDGISARDAQVNPFANPDRDGTKQTSLALGVQHRVNSALKLTASHVLSKQNVAYDGFGSAVEADTAKQTVALSSAGANWAITPNWSTALTVSQQKNQTQDQTNAVAGSDMLSRRQLIAATTTFETAVLGTVLLGAEREKNRLALDYYGPYGSHLDPAQRGLSAYFANIQGSQGAWGWTLALRRDAAKVQAGGSASSHQAGVSYALSPAWSLRGQTSTAFKRPTLSQIFDPNYGNTALKPETARNQELGVQWKTAAQLARLTWFKASTRNLIDSDPNTYQNINIAQSRNRGFEFIGETALPWAGGKAKLHLNDQNPVDAITGERLSRRAQFAAGLSLEGQAGAWGWNTALKHQGSRDDSGFNNRQLAGYTRIDAGLSYAVSERVGVSLALQNLGQAKDQTAYGYSATPRGGQLRLSYRL